MTFPQLELEKIEGPKANINTTLGTIKVQLFEKQAPKTVKNFVELAKKGYFDGVVFHRVIPDFMIQGGDPTGTGSGGESIYGEKFEDEFSDELFNITGAVSMANAGPNTNGSQFFIVSNTNMAKRMLKQITADGYPEEIVKVYKNGGTPWLDGKHTVFGQVISGMDVVQEISRVKRDAMDRPNEDVAIKSIEINK